MVDAGATSSSVCACASSKVNACNGHPVHPVHTLPIRRGGQEHRSRRSRPVDSFLRERARRPCRCADRGGDLDRRTHRAHCSMWIARSGQTVAP
jgi:hypothetical protein